MIYLAGALLPLDLDPRPFLTALAALLVAISAYWIAAALALLFSALRRRQGLLNALVTAAVIWLVLRALGVVLRLLVPCIAPDAEAAFGFLAALILSYLLPLRSWQRGLCLALVAVEAATLAYASYCQIPSQLALAAGLIALGIGLLWFLNRWPPSRRLWQRVALAIDNWSARQARTPLPATRRAVLEARLRLELGYTLEELHLLGAPGVHASTPAVLSGHTADGREQRLFAKIVTRQNWQTSVLYELLRGLQLRGRARMGPLWLTTKAMVEYEHYMMLLFADLGVPAPQPRGLYRLDRQTFALVSDYLEGAQSLREAGLVSAAYVRRALLALKRLRQADCAHRDIKASNLVLLPGDRFAFVDLALAEQIAGPRRLARDLADMLVVLSMHHEPAAVVRIALEIIDPEGLRRARSYLHRRLLNDETQKMVPLGLPRELRRLIGELSPRRASSPSG